MRDCLLRVFQKKVSKLRAREWVATRTLVADLTEMVWKLIFREGQQ